MRLADQLGGVLRQPGRLIKTAALQTLRRIGTMPMRPLILSRLLEWATAALPAIVVMTYAFLNIFSQPIPTGDGIMHTLEIRQIAETGRLPEQFTFFVMDVQDGQPIRRPIDYPLTFYVVAAPFWMFGGESGLFLVTALCAFLTLFFSYLLFSPLNRRLAWLVGAAVLLVTFERYTQVLLMEQLLLPVMLAAMYFYWKFLQARSQERWKWAVMTGLLIGLSVAIKQQGWILAAGLALHAAVTYVVMRVRGHHLSFRTLAVISAVAIATMAVPLANLSSRNGTILGTDFNLFPNLSERVPFLTPKYHTDWDFVRYVQGTVTYLSVYSSPWDVVTNFLQYPLNFGKRLGLLQQIWVVVATTLAVTGLIYSLVRRWWLGLALALVFAVEVIVAKRFNDIITNYHQLGLAAITLLMVAGGVGIYEWLRDRGLRYSLPLVLGVLVAFGVIALNSFVERIHTRTWGGPSTLLGGPALVKEFREMGPAIQAAVPENALGLATEATFAYVGKRAQVWPSWSGGGRLLDIFSADPPDEGFSRLKEFKIEYFYVDEILLKNCVGLGACMPSTGVMKLLYDPRYFEEIYHSKSGTLALYRVQYPSGLDDGLPK